MKYAIILVVSFNLFGCDAENCETVDTSDRYIITETEYYTVAQPDKTNWECK